MSKFEELINGDKPVLVDFFATWCGPCRMLGTILAEVKEELGEKITIIKIDVDANQQAAVQYQVRSVPTMLLFKNGKMLWRQSGVVAADELQKIIKPHL